jgi:hypothetical protein
MMTDSEGQRLQEYLTTFLDGHQTQTKRTNTIESNLTTIQSTISQIETELSAQLTIAYRLLKKVDINNWTR